jgi:signal transduction histidine kinase
MAAIPIVIFDNGFADILRGTLHNPPTELLSVSQMSFYALAKPGWSICPLGYSVLCEYDALGRKLVVPAIAPPDGPAPRRKFPNYELRFSKTQIESFLASHLTVSIEVKTQRDREYTNLTHDLRKISTEIYHTALTIRQALDRNSLSEARGHTESVIDSQQMMSLRLDIIDYESGDSSGRPNEDIDVYKKVDKVIKSFRNRARASRIVVNTEGRTDSIISGPPIFEIVPFVLIENAFKYAPASSAITIKYENKNEELIVRIESFGPKITEREKQLIFERNYRGEHAIDHGREGSGIGLFAAKTIIERHFSGKIKVNQLPALTCIDGFEFFTTRFTMILPVHREDAAGVVRNLPFRRHGWSAYGSK